MKSLNGKIDLNINVYFFTKKMEPYSLHWTNLSRKQKYIVETKNGIYMGTFLTQRMDERFPYIVLTFVKKDGICIPEALFNKCDIFYNASEYLKYKKQRADLARQMMETRALNKILKKLVNENFEW